jgi:hypothetical protein
MGSHDPFEHLKPKLWPKEGPWVKLTVWLLTTESQESTWFLCVKVDYDMPLESSRQGLQLRFRPHLDQRSSQEAIVPQLCGTPSLDDFGTPNGRSPETKAIWMPLPRGGAEYTMWGKVVASPESGSWWVFWIRGRPWLILTPKVFQPYANQLVCWFCASLLEWVNCLSLFLVPSRSSSTPLYPSKVLRVKERASSP